MIEDMAARNLNPHTQRGHISSRRRLAAWLKRSPDTATADEVRRFQLHLIESGESSTAPTGAISSLLPPEHMRHSWYIKQPHSFTAPRGC
jgi:integrase/recombinase XerD